MIHDSFPLLLLVPPRENLTVTQMGCSGKHDMVRMFSQKMNRFTLSNIWQLLAEW